MKIIVCINHTPDTETKVNVSQDGKSIDKTNVNWILNPYDEFAIEEALKTKEKFGGEVIAISLGNESHKESLRKSLAIGVDKAILLKDESERDSISVAKAISEEIKNHNADIIFFGKQSIDYYGEQLGIYIAELLSISVVSNVVKLEITDKKVVCEREIEGGKEVVETSIPCVITAQKGLNEPRYPSLKGIMASKSKQIEEKIPNKFDLLVETISMTKPSNERKRKIFEENQVTELVKILHEEAKVF